MDYKKFCAIRGLEPDPRVEELLAQTGELITLGALVTPTPAEPAAKESKANTAKESD